MSLLEVFPSFFLFLIPECPRAEGWGGKVKASLGGGGSHSAPGHTNGVWLGGGRRTRGRSGPEGAPEGWAALHLQGRLKTSPSFKVRGAFPISLLEETLPPDCPQLATCP